MRLYVDIMFILQLCTYITPVCGAHAMVICLFLSVSVLAGLRQGGGMLVICAFYSHHCGLDFLSQTWLRDPVETSRATSPLNDVTRFFKNAGRHSWYQSRVQRSATMRLEHT